MELNLHIWSRLGIFSAYAAGTWRTMQNAWPEQPRPKAVQVCNTGLLFTRSIKTFSLLSHDF
jgi:hypothetical protein